MAITIKSIPTLSNNEAIKFVQKANSALENRATIDFSSQVKSAQAILRKAKML